MRNKVDFSEHPERLFLNPWQDKGICLMDMPEFFWRPIPKGRINGFSVAHIPRINQKLNALLKSTRQRKIFSEAIEFNAVPALLERVACKKSHIEVGGKMMLSGASGTRLINAYLWENESAGFDPIERLDAHFGRTAEQNADAPLLLDLGEMDADIPFVIECRNTFNYFHFITESLAQLTLLDEFEFQGDIYFHFPNAEDKQRDFTIKFVEALFPELAERVHFERAPKEYGRALTAFELSSAYYQMPPDETEAMAQHVKDADLLRSVADRGVVSMNSVSRLLLALRRRALSMIEGRDFSHLPRRFFVGRDDRQSRDRAMAGQEKLFEHLQLFGFEFVVFENLDPLEQIALMANAEMMIAPHGAGLTNMLFANPDAWVIELGTLQTAQARWGDFWPLAHASGCHYVNFFADFNAKNQLLEPDFAKDGIVPVALSDAAVARVVGFAVCVLGHMPELASPIALRDLAGPLLETGEAEKAIALLEAHKTLVDDDATLGILKADCHKALGEPKSELLALDTAHKADPSRWRTLIRIIWCANACERPQVIRWALSRLQRDFPDRHAAFIGNHQWVRYVA